MPYKYKEPKTWADLFAVLEHVTQREVCPTFKSFVRWNRPKNLSELLEYRTRVLPTHTAAQLTVWQHIVQWWFYASRKSLRMSYARYRRMYENAPTDEDVAELRIFIKDLLRRAQVMSAFATSYEV